MTPLHFLRAYRSDRRILRGNYFSSSPLGIQEGDRIGVVLFNLGGPESLDDVEQFIYNLLMDPALTDVPVGGRLRHWLAKSVAYFRAGTLREKYQKIGGGSPLNQLASEQARCLQRHLNRQYGGAAKVDFRTYSAMRYGSPSSEEAAKQMRADGVDKVVLLPSYPQYSKFLTGSALAYWNALDEAGEIPPWPTTTVPEFAANPKYVQALSERIDEALQRFPKTIREEVALVFSAPTAPFQQRQQHEDHYCCHVQSTVQPVMRLRDSTRTFCTAFQSIIGPNYCLTPSTLETIEGLVDRGDRSILVVPLSYVTDHVNTRYELDIEVREEVEAYGVDHYEVTAGLNTHELLIEALGDATIAQLDLPAEVERFRIGGDGLGAGARLRPLDERTYHSVGHDSVDCEYCRGTVGAHQGKRSEEHVGSNVWTVSPAVRPDNSARKSKESPTAS